MIAVAGVDRGRDLGHVGVDHARGRAGGRPRPGGGRRRRSAGRRPGRRRSAASTRRGASPSRSAPSGGAPAARWAGSSRSNSRGAVDGADDRVELDRLQAEPALAASPSAATTSSKGRITLTSSGSRRSRAASRRAAGGVARGRNRSARPGRESRCPRATRVRIEAIARSALDALAPARSAASSAGSGSR